ELARARGCESDAVLVGLYLFGDAYPHGGGEYSLCTFSQPSLWPSRRGSEPRAGTSPASSAVGRSAAKSRRPPTARSSSACVTRQRRSTGTASRSRRRNAASGPAPAELFTT